jgi:hypothetical protein
MPTPGRLMPRLRQAPRPSFGRARRRIAPATPSRSRALVERCCRSAPSAAPHRSTRNS